MTSRRHDRVNLYSLSCRPIAGVDPVPRTDEEVDKLIVQVAHYVDDCVVADGVGVGVQVEREEEVRVEAEQQQGDDDNDTA